MEKGLSEAILDLYRTVTGNQTANYDDLRNEFANMELEDDSFECAKNTEQLLQPDAIV